MSRGLLDEHGSAGLERAHRIGAQSNRSVKDNQLVHHARSEEGIGQRRAALTVERCDPRFAQGAKLRRQAHGLQHPDSGR